MTPPCSESEFIAVEEKVNISWLERLPELWVIDDPRLLLILKWTYDDSDIESGISV